MKPGRRLSPPHRGPTKWHLTQDIKPGEEGGRLEVEQRQEQPNEVEGHCPGLVPPLLKQLRFRVIVENHGAVVRTATTPSAWTNHCKSKRVPRQRWEHRSWRIPVPRDPHLLSCQQECRLPAWKCCSRTLAKHQLILIQVWNFTYKDLCSSSRLHTQLNTVWWRNTMLPLLCVTKV